MSAIAFFTVAGVMPCFLLYAICISRRRLVSAIACCIASLMRSAYMITFPAALRAARPIICTRLVSERKKPILSASRIARWLLINPDRLYGNTYCNFFSHIKCALPKFSPLTKMLPHPQSMSMRPLLCH